ncbi:MAG: hypothetical protein KDN19_14485, partial [Verrucomicrobiae bacterium]|nr:hypothetical protein [Verrucomicrobiae bacterium]
MGRRSRFTTGRHCDSLSGVKTCFRFFLFLLVVVASAAILWFGPLTSRESRALGVAILKFDHRLRSSETGRSGDALSTVIRIDEIEGLPKVLSGKRIEIATQFPGRLKLATKVDGHDYRVGRDGETVWISVPHQELAIEGSNDVPRFASDPQSVRPVKLPEFHNPVPRWQLALLPAVFRVEPVEGEKHAYRCRPRSVFAHWIGLPENLVLALNVTDGGGLEKLVATSGDKRLGLHFESFGWVGAADADGMLWGLPSSESAHVERVALSHLDKFAQVLLKNLGAKIPTLPPVDGSRRVLATHGKGRLE